MVTRDELGPLPRWVPPKRDPRAKKLEPDHRFVKGQRLLRGGQVFVVRGFVDGGMVIMRTWMPRRRFHRYEVEHPDIVRMFAELLPRKAVR